MQTIRIYRKGGGLAAKFTGAPHKVETDEMRERYPEGSFLWLR